MGLLEGKSVIVTGAGGGVGRAAALRFAKEGARLTLTDMEQATGAETAELVKAAGGEAQFMAGDLVDEPMVEGLVAAAVERYGRLDAAFNNAGINPPFAMTGDYLLEDWERVIRIDLTAPFLCMKHEIRAMLKTGGGAIANTSSVLAEGALPHFGPYCAAKAGLLSATRVAAAEYARKNIRVNAVLPGTLKTPMTAGFSPELVEEINRKCPMGRFGEPEEIAAAALFLCSSESSFMTGQGIMVDGGAFIV